MTPDVYDAVVYCRGALALAARPRVSEEILRLLRGGQARRTIYLAWETGVLDVLLPELAALLYDDGEEKGAGYRVFRLLEYVISKQAESGPLDNTVLWTILLLEPMKEACDGTRDRAAAVAAFLEPLMDRLAIPRRYADGMRRIVAVMPRLLTGKVGASLGPISSNPHLEVAAADSPRTDARPKRWTVYARCLPCDRGTNVFGGSPASSSVVAVPPGGPCWATLKGPQAERPTVRKASTAASTSEWVCAAESCTRMRARPRGTTGWANATT